MSVQADIGQKIKEAIQHYRIEAQEASMAAELIEGYWQARDYRWMAEAGVITQREADIMLGVSPNRRKRVSRNKKRTSRRAR